MEKIKFIVDSASDIPDADLAAYDIDMLSVPIAVDGESFFERKSFGIVDFYDILVNAKELPVTSRIPIGEYFAAYLRAYRQGFTHIISVTINAKGSGIYESAQLAKVQFYEQFPEAHGNIQIHVIDSRTYSLAYGYPVLQAAEMAYNGQPVCDILDYLDDWFSGVVFFLACYELEYAKRSGRISAAAAIVGGALGIRPIMSMIDGVSKTVLKLRGDHNVVPQMAELYKTARVSAEDSVFVVAGSELSYGEELCRLLKKELKREIPLYRVGAAVAINSGPRILALVFKGKKRPKPANA